MTDISINGPLPEVADVLVIGAGASGSVAVQELASSGFSVVCLEQGGWTRSDEFVGDKPEWELQRQKQWHPNPNVRQNPADYPINTDESDVNPLMFSGVGGSTILYAAHWCRFLPSDFQVKIMDGIADDWPFTYEDLEPFYDEMDRQMGVSGLGDNTAPWNWATGIVMLIGRYLPILVPLAIVGSLMAKRRSAESAGTLSVEGNTFGIMLLITILIFGALTFFPAAALGPIAEHVTLMR